MMKATTVLLFVLVGCSSPQVRVAIPEPGRVNWEQCHNDLMTWCRQRAHGDAAQTNACEQDRANEYAGLIDDAARRDYLGSHGCPI
jgi:hypothetical protein